MADSADPGSAADLFAEWLARAGGEDDAGFDALCRAHPEREPELRVLHDDWRRLRPRLARLAGDGSEGGAAAHAEVAQVIERLRGRAGFARYAVGDELARGGMGSIRRVVDLDLKRELAMKVALDAGGDGSSPRALLRFLEEAHTTGRLDHPGIVPVHDLGVDPSGRLYFTMRLVRGQDLSRILERLRAGDAEWTRTRVLHALLKACEALAFAHSKGVIHRDLKPGNVMVGGFGEVYVMDWGLAQVRGAPDEKDVRLRPPRGDAGEPGARGQHDSPLLTMDGDVVGTPAYMSPEQARGDLRAMGPWSDVYSVGAILYHLLAGAAPFAGPGESPGNVAIWTALRAGPPAPIESLAPDAEPELIAICAKAMARDPRERYRDIRELALDLRAYLEGRVVHAHRSGPLVELKKWIQRNRALSASVAAAALLALAGLASTASVQAARRRAEARLNADLAAANADLALSAGEARRERDVAVRAADFLVELFEAPDPSVALGTPASAEDLLERGAARISDPAFLEADPLVRARLLDATGRAFRGLGRYERAGELLAQAHAIRADARGPDHAETLRAAAELAGARAKSGRLEDAALLLADAHARAERALGARDALALELESDLGVVLHQAGRLDEAALHLEASLAGRRAVLGARDPSTLVTLSALASLEVTRGRHARAEELFAELFESLHAVQGEDHPRTLVARNNLATLRALLGRHEEALELFRAGGESARRVLGPTHPDVLVWRINEARLLQRVGRADEARALLEAELAPARERLGADHPRVVPMIHVLGTLHLEAGRLAEAAALLEEAHERFGALRGPEHFETLTTRAALGRLRLTQDRALEAEPLLASAHDGLAATLGATSRPALAAQCNLALARARLGRPDDSRALYAACLASARAAHGDASPTARVPWRNLIALELRAGRPDEARRLATELLAATPPDDPDHARHADLARRAATGDPTSAPPDEIATEGG